MAEPKNPRFEQVVRDSFAAQQHMVTIGARLAHVAAGQIEIRVPETCVVRGNSFALRSYMTHSRRFRRSWADHSGTSVSPDGVRDRTNPGK